MISHEMELLCYRSQFVRDFSYVTFVLTSVSRYTEQTEPMGFGVLCSHFIYIYILQFG